jgi:hypothetical protein
MFERCDQTLFDIVGSNVSSVKLPLYCKDKGLEIIAFTVKIAPSLSVEMTPYELWHGIKPKLYFSKKMSMQGIYKMFTTKIG